MLALNGPPIKSTKYDVRAVDHAIRLSFDQEVLRFFDLYHRTRTGTNCLLTADQGKTQQMQPSERYLCCAGILEDHQPYSYRKRNNRSSA